MNCTICGKRVVLVPSAVARARAYGGKPSDYTRLFPNHSECEVAARERAAVALMRRIGNHKS